MTKDSENNHFEKSPEREWDLWWDHGLVTSDEFLDLHFQKLQFNHAIAYSQNIQASDGVIYVLDAVLPVPLGTIADILALPQWSLSTFFNDVIEAGYGPILNDSQSKSNHAKPSIVT